MRNGEKRKRRLKIHFSQKQSTVRQKTLDKSVAALILSFVNKGFLIRLRNKHFIRHFMRHVCCTSSLDDGSLCFHWRRSACQHLRIARGVGAQVYVLQQWQDCPYSPHAQALENGPPFLYEWQPPVLRGLEGLSYGVGRPGVLVMWVPRGILLLLVLWRTSMCKWTTEGLTYRCVDHVNWTTNHNWASTCGMKNN